MSRQHGGILFGQRIPPPVHIRRGEFFDIRQRPQTHPAHAGQSQHVSHVRQDVPVSSPQLLRRLARGSRHLRGLYPG